MPSQKYQSERFVEVKRYPSTDVQAPLSSAILVISLIVFFMKFDSNSVITVTIFLSSSALIVFLIITLPQILKFRKIVKSFKNNKNNYVLNSSTTFTDSLSIFFLILLIIGPFILSSIFSPAEWFGSILGIIISFSSYQLFFPIYVRHCETERGLRLEYYEIWAYNMENKKVIIERGVRDKTASP